ncbi:unnamed protein product [Thelazia callipaeda]|uniref:Protein-tyrosine-phosphatase n=1 Tax=Thelazia callipaeda TaxID=103827 RepID=A0A0N5CMZ9_THECL|nr:unnamed protein product [Thelazia callipaeda]
MKPDLRFYLIFILIGKGNSERNSNSINFRDSLNYRFTSTSESAAESEEFTSKSLHIETTSNHSKTARVFSDNQKLKSSESKLLVQRSLPTASDFSIVKDPINPSTMLNVILPSSPTHFEQFIAKVVDISPVTDTTELDINKTFVANPSNFSTINIHGLHAGHQYSISVLGRQKGESEMIKEERVIMNPVAPNFSSSNASVLIYHTNITLRALKPQRALQDSFQIAYVQLDPLRYFPKLEINDIPEQNHIEIYLGNLLPGRNYNVSVTPQIMDVEGQPWKDLLTTKPYSPENLTVTEMNTTCLKLSWFLTSRTGADFIVISYRATKITNPLTTIKVPRNQTSVEVCNKLQPGRTYLFVAKTVKSKTESEAVQILYTVKPKTPKNLKILTDYEKRKFRLSIDIAPESESHTEKCFVSLVNEKLDVIERISDVNHATSNSSERQCSLYVDLRPGRRYEVSAKTISENTSSNIISKSFALQPAFDMKSFGLQLSETNGTLMLKWPAAEMTLARLDDVWENIVGPDSTLHLRVEPQSKSSTSTWQEQPKRFERRQYEHDPLIVPKLKRGACYKANLISFLSPLLIYYYTFLSNFLMGVQIYTVTKSGIASEEKYEQIFRISAPFINITREEVAKSTATFRVVLESPIISDPPECNLHIVVVDMRNMTIYDRITPLIPEISPIVLEGLRPYHRYTINSQIMCGKPNDKICLAKLQTMDPITFDTRQDRPGPIQNLTVRILNPYSVQLFWLPPALPNGIITHYIIDIHPMEDERENDWSVSVGVGAHQPSTSLHGNNYNHNNVVQQPVKAIVDNLIGGMRYRMDVRAVTEAGEGDLSAASDAVHAEMPILPPPLPSSRVEIVHNTIHSTDLEIRYSTAMFNTKHGYLKKSALIVAEVGDSKKNVDSITDQQNKTFTWGQAQRFDVWPAYVAIETAIEPLRKFFPPRFVSEIIGADNTCAETEHDAICNGPLKSSTSYRFKLRLYTAPNLWTDSEYSETVTTS